MPFVLDASVAACWVFEDEDHPIATQALERDRLRLTSTSGVNHPLKQKLRP